MVKEYTQIIFNDSYHPEFEGWVNVYCDEIIISLIESKHKGIGCFRKYFDELRLMYNKIIIPTPSKQMKEIALHLGFIEKDMFFEEPFNEMGTVMIMEKGD